MKIFNDLVLQFKQANWAPDPQLALIDTILEKHPELYEILQRDIIKNTKSTSNQQFHNMGLYKRKPSITNPVKRRN